MRINPITLVGIALVVLGIVAFAYQGITYTSREGYRYWSHPCHRRHSEDHPTLFSRGGAALVGGIVLVLVGAKKA